jgi:hypothetical protein
VIGYVPAGVAPSEASVLLPPQLRSDRAGSPKTSIARNTRIARPRRRPPLAAANRPKPLSPSHVASHDFRRRLNAAFGPVVATVRLVVALLSPGVTLVGLNLHVVSAGSPEQASVTTEFQGAGLGRMVIVWVADCPAFTVFAGSACPPRSKLGSTTVTVAFA